NGRRPRSSRPRARRRFLRDADEWTRRGTTDRGERAEGPRLPDLDARCPARFHPARDLGGLWAAPPADPDPLARAVHRPGGIGRLRTRTARARHHAPPTPAGRPAAPGGP